MKTDELIRALSADLMAPRTPINRTLTLALLAGAAAAVVVFVLLLDVRTGAADSVSEWRFLLKFVVTLSLAASSYVLLLRSASPVRSRRSSWRLLLIAPFALCVGVASELMMVPADTWSRHLIGTNAFHCLTLIPLLSLAPLFCVFVALKRGAPEHPGRAGAIGGLACSGIAAALYALNCPDDSPLFVATWYVMAIAAITATAAVVGARILRW